MPSRKVKPRVSSVSNRMKDPSEAPAPEKFAIAIQSGEYRGHTAIVNITFSTELIPNDKLNGMEIVPLPSAHPYAQVMLEQLMKARAANMADAAKAGG